MDLRQQAAVILMQCLKRFLLSAVATASFAVSPAVDMLLVSNWSSSQVTRYDLSNGASLGALSGGSLSGPQAVRLGSDGLVYVASENNNSIQRFNASTGVFVDTFASGMGFNGPTALTWDADGDLLIGNFNSDSVERFNGTTGAFQGTLVGSGSGGLNGPDVGTVVGPDGTLYVPSFWNHSVKRYDANTGAFLGDFIPFNSGGLTQPRTILFHGGSVYVSSDSGDKVLRYNMDGSFHSTFVSTGSGGLDGASGMAFYGDHLYVSSINNNRVLRFDGSTGAFVDTYISSGLSAPTYLAVVPEPGTLLVLGTAAGAIAARRKRKA